MLPSNDGTRALIDRLLDYGLSPDFVSAVTDVPVTAINKIYTLRYTTHRMAPEDEELAEKMRKLVDKAYHEAMMILEMGPTDLKMSVIRTVLAGAGRLIGKESSSTMEEGRAALESLMRDMRQVEPVTE